MKNILIFLRIFSTTIVIIVGICKRKETKGFSGYLNSEYLFLLVGVNVQ